MGTKVPLAERFPDNGAFSTMEPHWRDEAVKPLKSTAHLYVKVDRENANKRSRDCPSQQKWQHMPATVGVKSSNKKSRVPRQTVPKASKPSPLPPGRPRLARRVGGIAPNGNPQCWYAPHESEMDPHRIAQRLKQVEFGKNSAGYKAYIASAPREARKGEDPQTPDVRTKCSKRCFDGLLRSWRRRLHRYDPPDTEAGGAVNYQAGGALEGALPAEDANDDMPCTPVMKHRSHLQEGNALGSLDSEFATGTDADNKPVPWEEIERMSLCSPLWGDDKDSDISEPDSQDRVTIYTNDLSPTASELACVHQAETQSEPWGTPRSRLSMPKDEFPDDDDDVVGTPPSPFSPWAPWGTAKASFADALRSPVAVLDLEAPAGSIPMSSKISAPVQDVQVKQEDEEAPSTFGDAFAQGILRNRSEYNEGPCNSLFGKGVRGRVSTGDSNLRSGQAGAQNFILDEDLGPEGNSISMKAMPRAHVWEGEDAHDN